jgi:hypothetical protein
VSDVDSHYSSNDEHNLKQQANGLAKQQQQQAAVKMRQQQAAPVIVGDQQQSARPAGAVPAQSQPADSTGQPAAQADRSGPADTSAGAHQHGRHPASSLSLFGNAASNEQLSCK